MATIESLLSAATLPDSPTARLDAELLLAHVLGKSRSYLRTWPEQAVTGEQAQRFAALIERRRTGEPVAYMGEGGTIPFMGMLGDKFPRTQFVITGVLGPHSNAHGPNEFLHIPTGKKVTVATALMIAAELNHEKAVDILLAAGADKTIKDKQGKRAGDLTSLTALREKLAATH